MRPFALALVLLLSLGGASLSRAGFPEGWTGVWEGTCESQGGPAGSMQFGISLEIAPREESSALTWKTTYRMAEQQEQLRDYLLQPTGEARHWVLDERNGIRLDTYVAGEVLYQNFYFPTSNTALTARWERRGDELGLDIPTFLTRPGNPTTGPGGVQVVSFQLSGLQRCSLTRQ